MVGDGGVGGGGGAHHSIHTPGDGYIFDKDKINGSLLNNSTNNPLIFRKY